MESDKTLGHHRGGAYPRERPSRAGLLPRPCGPRAALMRAREFLMKDMYSFDATKEEALRSYEKVWQLYLAYLYA